MKKNDNNPDIKPSQQGTGSAEQTGRNRNEQKERNNDMDKSERKDVAGSAGVGRKQLTTLKDMGALSGRDDYAGGSGDDMENQSSDESTNR